MNIKDDPKPWKVLNSEYLFRRPWLTARKDCVQLPSGVVNQEYYILEYPTWVNVIARTVEGDFLFIRQYRHGIGRTCFEIVAGVMDDTDPSPLEAAQRELMEETGFGGGKWELLAVLSPNASANTNLTYCYLAEGVSPKGQPHLEATEDITHCLLKEEEVRELLESGEIVQALMAAPLWKYMATRTGNKG